MDELVRVTVTPLTVYSPKSESEYAVTHTTVPIDFTSFVEIRLSVQEATYTIRRVSDMCLVPSKYTMGSCNL